MGYVQHMFAGGPLVVGLVAIAALLLLAFLGIYAVRGASLWFQLHQLSRRLKALGNEPRPTLRAKLDEAFRRTRCQHAWSEYSETLHDQYDTEAGEHRVRDVRATVPAEGFLNPEAIIDSRLGAEFFRHLPGIFTGLGIIGTFYGLIRGLMAFDPGVDAEKLKLSLGGLFANVMDAFMFSMTAIAMAMLVTLIEKLIYASCVKWLGQVANDLDSLFRSGLGEEYLSDLVHASQDNATQTRQLKESLVADLKELLVGLTERQITATREMSNELGQQIEGSLRAPLAAIAETVRATSGQQASAASATLESLMRAFIDRMQETVGGQLSGLGEMLRASTQSMGQVEATLRSLVTDMRQTSEESTTGLRQAMQSLMEQMTTHQQQQAEQSAAGMNGLLARMEGAFDHIAQHERDLREQSAQSIKALLESIGSRVSQLTEANQQTQAQGAELARAMGEVSTRAVAGIEDGAKAVASALAGVAQVTARLEGLAGQMASMESAFGDSARTLAEASAVVSGATQSLGGAVGALGTTARQLEQLGSTVQAESEARSGLLADLRALTAQSRSTGESLAGLTDAVHAKLDDSLDRFGNAITRTLEQNLATYNKQLSDAVNTLTAAYDELLERIDGVTEP